MASDDPIHGFQNSAPDYADDYPMLGEINNVFSKLAIQVLTSELPRQNSKAESFRMFLFEKSCVQTTYHLKLE